jgi:hypothetical protein
MLDDGVRQSGRTSASIQAAPPAAVYIAPCAPACRYVEGLAAHLGRPDLKVVPPWWLLGGERLRGYRRHVTFDHALFDLQPPGLSEAMKGYKAWFQLRLAVSRDTRHEVPPFYCRMPLQPQHIQPVIAEHMDRLIETLGWWRASWTRVVIHRDSFAMFPPPLGEELPKP